MDKLKLSEKIRKKWRVGITSVAFYLPDIIVLENQVEKLKFEKIKIIEFIESVKDFYDYQKLIEFIEKFTGKSWDEIRGGG